MTCFITGWIWLVVWLTHTFHRGRFNRQPDSISYIRWTHDVGWQDFLHVLVTKTEARSRGVIKHGLPENPLSGWWFRIFFIFPYTGNNYANWPIFFRGVETTNQSINGGFGLRKSPNGPWLPDLPRHVMTPEAIHMYYVFMVGKALKNLNCCFFMVAYVSYGISDFAQKPIGKIFLWSSDDPYIMASLLFDDPMASVIRRVR